MEYYNKIPIYPIFYLLKGDYRSACKQAIDIERKNHQVEKEETLDRVQVRTAFHMVLVAVDGALELEGLQPFAPSFSWPFPSPPL